MITIKKGNAVDALLNKEIDYLVHSTNAQGVFSSGIAGEIRRRIPEAYVAYMKQYNMWKCHGKESIPLGDLSSGGKVINLCGQEFYGRSGKRYTNYGAIASGLCDLFCYLQDIDERQCRNIKLGLPLVGCGLGGAEEDIIMEIIEHCLGNIYKEVVVFKL